jgi:DNA-binding NarL/FixJ family response regulator
MLVSQRKICSEAVDGSAATARAKSHKADTVISQQWNIQPQGLFEAVPLMKKELRDSEILNLGHRGSRRMLPVTLRAGARGLVLKSNMDCKPLSAVELA